MINKMDEAFPLTFLHTVSNQKSDDFPGYQLLGSTYFYCHMWATDLHLEIKNKQYEAGVSEVMVLA